MEISLILINELTQGKGLAKQLYWSPRSEVMDQDFNHKDSFKKRKTMPRWTQQVKICPETGVDGSLDDGHNWRKYGQKDILGAKFPRGYYRCTHRNVQGCLATKQVQRSDEDPTILEVTYRGRHTCRKASHMISKAVSSKRKMGLGENKVQKRHKIEPEVYMPLEEQNPEAFFNFGAELQVKTEDLDSKEDIFPSFCLTSPSIGSENEDNLLFTDTMMENHFMETFSSPKFMSPTTSESNIFCLSPPPCQFGSSGLLCQNVQTSESDATDIVSAQTSVCNSPIAELDLFDFDSEFQEFFSS
ncbi:putative WRKY transcription factor 53 [Senna tora]|uniref:Putative WRKY transcription factor 53 n=1 Tax=Senna tora TaxID=362788 RepID=A0A834XFE5_9FABA|nr:putative WRKY transcription factor 53 [Senna tora]